MKLEGAETAPSKTPRFVRCAYRPVLRTRRRGAGVAGSGTSAAIASLSWRGLAPAARAIAAIVRRETTDRGWLRVGSTVSAH
jgi:hypothetical protein